MRGGGGAGPGFPGLAPVELEVVREQIRLSLAAYPVAAIKTGLLHSREVIELVAQLYAELAGAARPPLVVDPVMVATSGAPLLSPDAVAAYTARLFPLATLITPNRDEARRLLGGQMEIAAPAAMREAGRELSARFGTGFLMKGGHFGGDEAIDWLCAAGRLDARVARGVHPRCLDARDRLYLFGRDHGRPGEWPPSGSRRKKREDLRERGHCGVLPLGENGCARRRAQPLATGRPYSDDL